MKRILIASALVAVAAFSVPAFAATTTATTTKTTTAAATPAKPTVLTFKLIDANHDGKISYDELKKYFPKVTKAEFAKFDTNKDGFYDHTEFAAFYKAQQAPAASTTTTTTTKTTTTPAAKPAATPAK